MPFIRGVPSWPKVALEETFTPRAGPPRGAKGPQLLLSLRTAALVCARCAHGCSSAGPHPGLGQPQQPGLPHRCLNTGHGGASLRQQTGVRHPAAAAGTPDRSHVRAMGSAAPAPPSSSAFPCESSCPTRAAQRCAGMCREAFLVECSYGGKHFSS